MATEIGTSYLIVFVLLLSGAAAKRSGSDFARTERSIVDDRSKLCRVVHICHNSKTNAGAGTVLDAFQSLASKLHLVPLSDYFHVAQQHKHACIRDGCCCSSPLAVQVSIPLDPAGDEASNLMNSAILADFIDDKLPKQLAGAACVGELKECYQPLSVERRRLLGGSSDVTYETAVIPVPEMPTGIAPGTTDVMESAPTSSSSLISTGTYGEAAAGYGSYGYYTQHTAAAYSDHHMAGRSLLAQSEYSLEPLQLKNFKPSGCPPCPACTAPDAEPQHSSGTSINSLSSQDSKVPGSCYCRYDSSKAAWALKDPTCRSALYSKCGPAGSLLECAHVEAFYSHGNLAKAITGPHGNLISAFLYVDCPPAPPCSCKLAESVNAASNMRSGEVEAELLSQCCDDLRAHCQVPFSGLDCAEVTRFCSSQAAPGQLASIYNYVAVKTHNIHCSQPQWAAAYTSQQSSVKAPRLAAKGSGNLSEEAATLLLLQDDQQHGEYFVAGQHRLSTAVTILLTLMGSCLFAAVMFAGIISLVQQYGIRQCTMPPLSEW